MGVYTFHKIQISPSVTDMLIYLIFNSKKITSPVNNLKTPVLLSIGNLMRSMDLSSD